MREHLDSIYRQSGVIPEQLANRPELPPLLAHLWGWFVDVCNDRQSNGLSVARITSSDIRNWCWATGNNPARWEIAVIKRLDSLYIASQPKPKTT